MARLFLLLAILLAIFWWLGSRVRARRAEPPPADAGVPRQGADGRAQEPMVPCAHCGVHLPRSEAIAYQGLHYCRAAHLPESRDRFGDEGGDNGDNRGDNRGGNPGGDRGGDRGGPA